MSVPSRPITPPPKPSAAFPATIDASWQRWIVEQRLRGCSVESILQVIESVGLSPIDAERVVAALAENPAYAAAQALQQRQRKLESVALNLQRLWVSDPRYRTVEKRARIADEEFAERYARGCRPVVITGHTNDWPAMRKWSPEDLKKRFGHLDVDVQWGRDGDGNYEQNKLLLTRRVNLGAFVDQVVRGGVTNDYYLTANNEVLRQPDFAALLEDVGSLPPLCDRSQLPERSSFWFGPAGTVTPLHHDTLMLFHTQVVGRKRWRLVSPLEWSRVYNRRHVFSDVDLERLDPKRFPAFAEATVLEVVVEPGETLFLPLGWWHQVTSLDLSLSFSYSCLAMPNHFEYADPAQAIAETLVATPPDTADAIRGELLNAVTAAGLPDSVEAQFNDGSSMRLRPAASGVEVQVDRKDSRASHYAGQLASVSMKAGAAECHFTDGSSIRIVAFR